jgi:alpha-glucosidase (family GH31 glycosyl hydrolase)
LNRTNGTFRPFLLTRSFFSGTQKFAWTWSGDNSAQWTDLKISIASLIVSGLGGIPFTGTDVGGFFLEMPLKNFLFVGIRLVLGVILSFVNTLISILLFVNLIL